MAVSYTLTRTVSGWGPFKAAYGTFTSAAGDGNGETLTNTTHGLGNLIFAFVSLDGGAIAAQNPKISISAGTVTWTVEDTLGYSGRFFLVGV